MDELTTVIKDALENRGVLRDLRGRVRAEVFKALEDTSIDRPKLPSENLLINELVREYCLYNNYHHTLSVLMQESRQPEQPLDRDFLSSELHMTQTGETKLPLLYGVVSHFTDQHSNQCIEIQKEESEDDVEEQELQQPKVTIIKK